MDEQFYTAEEAMKVLKKTKTVFYEMINSGEVPYEIEPGRKRGKRFPKAAIDVLAEIDENQPKKGPLSFTLQTVAELWESIEITKALYTPEDVVSFKRLMEWRSANSDIFMSLKEGTELIGEVTFVPIDEKVAIALVNGIIKDKDIPPRSIRKWTEDNLSIYIATIEVLPSGDFQRDKERGMFLLRHTLRWAVLATFQYDVKNWYAVGATQDGVNILETLGFRRIQNSKDDKTKGYILEAKKEPVKLIGSYVRQLEGSERNKKEEQNEQV